MAQPSFASASHQQLLSVEHLFFNNLLLLGFHAGRAEQQHHIRFGPDMFKSPNQKGCEVILHYLMTKLDTKRTEKDLRTVWPIMNKNQTHTFRQYALSWLQELLQQANGSTTVAAAAVDVFSSGNASVRQSLLQSCHGERFVSLMWQASTAVLRIVLEREAHRTAAAGEADDDPFAPTIPWLALNASRKRELRTEQDVACLRSTLQLHVRQQTRQLLQQIEQISDVQQQWRQFAQEISQEYNQTVRQEGEQLQKQQEFNASVDRAIFSEEVEEWRMQQLDRMQKGWNRIMNMYDNSTTTRETIEQIKTAKIDRVKLDAQQLASVAANTNVNEFFVKDFREETPKMDLNLLLQSWNDTLKKLDARIGAPSSTAAAQQSPLQIQAAQASFMSPSQEYASVTLPSRSQPSPSALKPSETLSVLYDRDAVASLVNAYKNSQTSCLRSFQQINAEASQLKQDLEESIEGLSRRVTENEGLIRRRREEVAHPQHKSKTTATAATTAALQHRFQDLSIAKPTPSYKVRSYEDTVMAAAAAAQQKQQEDVVITSTTTAQQPADGVTKRLIFEDHIQSSDQIAKNVRNAALAKRKQDKAAAQAAAAQVPSLPIMDSRRYLSEEQYLFADASSIALQERKLASSTQESVRASTSQAQQRPSSSSSSLQATPRDAYAGYRSSQMSLFSPAFSDGMLSSGEGSSYNFGDTPKRPSSVRSSGCRGSIGNAVDLAEEVASGLLHEDDEVEETLQTKTPSISRQSSDNRFQAFIAAGAATEALEPKTPARFDAVAASADVLFSPPPQNQERKRRESCATDDEDDVVMHDEGEDDGTGELQALANTNTLVQLDTTEDEGLVLRDDFVQGKTLVRAAALRSVSSSVRSSVSDAASSDSGMLLLRPMEHPMLDFQAPSRSKLKSHALTQSQIYDAENR